MRCVHCSEEQDLPEKKVPFRAACSKCGRDLHSCLNCKHYAPGKPNDCAVPGTEYVRDREMYNFCEDFFPKNSPSTPTPKKKDSFDDLFK
jgi:hypothetical protein